MMLVRSHVRLTLRQKLPVFLAGCLIFSLSCRLHTRLTFEQYLLSVVSDHYYLIYFVIPMALLTYYSWMEDDSEIAIVRFPSYYSYFCRKWLAAGAAAAAVLGVQTGVALLAGAGLAGGNRWALSEGTAVSELFSVLELYFKNPVSAFAAYTMYQLAGTWFLAGLCMWLHRVAGSRGAVRILMVLYALAAVWIKIPGLQGIPVTGLNHLLILHHSLGLGRLAVTVATAGLLAMIILWTARDRRRFGPLSLPAFGRGLVPYYMRKLFSIRNLAVLCAVAALIAGYKGLAYPDERMAEDWVLLLFSGHGTGYLHILSFLEMQIVNGAPVYLLAAFMEETVRGQPLFVTIRASGRRNMLTALWKAGFLILFLYCVIWFLGGLLGMKLLGYELTVHAWKCLAGSVGLKFCDVLFQYLVMFTIYLCTKQITAGFLAILGGNFLCILPSGFAAYCPFGLSSTVRLGTAGLYPGITFRIAFDIQILLILLLGAWNLKYGWRRLLNQPL